jgi:GDP-4-dehydro-6-deoxy-D-mannose reductase
MGALGLLEHARANPRISVVFVGSSEEYKRKPGEDVSFSEEDDLDSAAIYGSSKVIMETMGRAYAAQYGVKAFFTRSFNHTGPGQAPVYVISDFARQVAQARLGKGEKVITTGNTALERDFLDVRDVVRAYCLIAEKGVGGQAYNVSSGTARSLSWCLDFMLDYAGVKDARIVIDPKRVRAGEPARITGLNGKLKGDTGWEPEKDIGSSLKDVVDYWIDKESGR